MHRISPPACQYLNKPSKNLLSNGDHKSSSGKSIPKYEMLYDEKHGSYR